MIEDVIAIALRRGLTLQDFESMTVGMIVDFITACSNREIGKDDTVYATKADYDAF